MTDQPDPAPKPVFVDRTGRRARLVALLGAVLAIPVVGSLALFIVSMSSGTTPPAPGLPGVTSSRDPSASATVTTTGRTADPTSPAAPGTGRG